MTNLVVASVHTPMRPVLLRPAFERSTLASDDAAIEAMTDFMRERPITIEEHRSIDVALDDMIRFGVRALLVTRDRGVVGLITSYDIQGERPMQLLQRSAYRTHEEILVRDIMTPWDQLSVLERQLVEYASVSDLLDVFRQTAMMHLLVVETSPSGAAYVCGLVSRTQLERQFEGSTRRRVEHG